MFRSRRSTLVRRLWRSRLGTDSEGRDGGECAGGEDQDGSYGGRGDAEDGRGSEQRPVTLHGDRRLTGDAYGGHPADGVPGAGRSPDPDRGAMCAPEHRCPRPGQDGDGRTVTCCVFREWNLRPRRPYSALRKDCGGSSCRCGPRHKRPEGAALGEQELKNTVHALFKRLCEEHLGTLLTAVETQGGDPGACVPVPHSEGDRQSSPPYLLCKLYRWRDLQPSAPMKRVHHCRGLHAVDGAQVCCNPYHYSRLCGPESPPPPYSVSQSDTHTPLESTQSHTETVPLHHINHPQVPPRDFTDSGSSLGSWACGGRSQWCSVAYWEQRRRVGGLYAAREPALSVFYDLPQGSGLCLAQLHGRRPRHRRDDAADADPDAGRGGVARARAKIGHGIALSREPDGVWLYNRSRHPVFVHSPTLDPPPAGPAPQRAGGLAVWRVAPGFSLRVFDYERAAAVARPEGQQGPWDPRSVRISFAKGWGPCYCRQAITACPCWLEVLLAAADSTHTHT